MKAPLDGAGHYRWDAVFDFSRKAGGTAQIVQMVARRPDRLSAPQKVRDLAKFLGETSKIVFEIITAQRPVAPHRLTIDFYKCRETSLLAIVHADKACLRQFSDAGSAALVIVRPLLGFRQGEVDRGSAMV